MLHGCERGRPAVRAGSLLLCGGVARATTDVGAKAFLAFFDLLLPLGVGYALAGCTKLRRESFDRMLRAAIVTVFPAMALLSLWRARLESELLWLPVLGMAMQVMPGLVGLLRSRSKPYNSLETGSYVLSSLLSNRGVVGGLTLYILFGEEGYMHSRLVIVLAIPSLFLIYFPIARYFRISHDAGSGEKLDLRSIIFNRNQAPVIGLAAGFLLNMAGVARPTAFDWVFAALVHVVAWMFLVPVGASMDFGQMRRHWRHMLDLLPIKFVVTPLAMFAMGRAVGLEGTILHSLVVLSFAPTAINAVIAAKLHDLDVHVATTAFVLTTGVYVVVVLPIILAFCAMTGIT